MPNIRGEYLGTIAVSPNQCIEYADNLKRSFIDWLNSSDFQILKAKLYYHLGKTKEEIRFILKTQNSILKKLPWSEWDLFEEKYHRAEIAISPITYRKIESIGNNDKLRILAVLGNSEGIDIKQDENTLKKFESSKVEIKFLPEPTRSEINKNLKENKFNILFFSGHSSSQDGTGKIFINKKDSLTIERLKSSLRKAIRNGLKLAIFNSCDALKLADDLAELNIPQVIVMREPVPDEVAQRFLEFFLEAFSGGKSLYLSVRDARERLRDEEDFDEKFPNASWLPIIYQNPTVKPPTWKELKGESKWFKPILITVVLIVVLLSGLFLFTYFSEDKPIPITSKKEAVLNSLAVVKETETKNDKENNEELEQAEAFLLGYFLWTIPSEKQSFILKKISEHLKCVNKNSKSLLSAINDANKSHIENQLNKEEPRKTLFSVALHDGAPLKTSKILNNYFMAGHDLSISVENKEDIVKTMVSIMTYITLPLFKKGVEFNNTQDFVNYATEHFINEIAKKTECSF
ncbi:CHAT domain-containing protein [Candidatus Halobeggiatoa sp. HSG11]|nr:CHAT domain-containing protein [Candidatus Halobeggiatoa sp. HSG11]